MTRRSSSRIRIGAYASPALNGVLLATAALGLAGCEADGVPVPHDEAGYVSQLGADDPIGQASAFKTTQECVASGDFTQQECDDAQRESLAVTNAWAPKYESVEDCQQDYDDCRPNTAYSGGQSSGFSPFMTGFMVSRMLDSMDNRHYTPIYRTRDDSYVSGNGYGVPRMGTYPVGRSGYDGFTRPPTTVTRMGLGQTFRSQGGVPGSKTTVAKLAASTSTRAVSTAAWGSTKSASWSSGTSISGRSSGATVSRGGFGGTSRGGGIGGGRSGG